MIFLVKRSFIIYLKATIILLSLAIKLHLQVKIKCLMMIERRLYTKFTLLLFVSLLLISCTKDEPEDELEIQVHDFGRQEFRVDKVGEVVDGHHHLAAVE